MHRASWILYLCSLLSAILAMKTKEIAFTLPFVIALYEFMFFKEKFKKRILYLAPILLTMLIIPLSLIDMNRPLGEILGGIDESTRKIIATEVSTTSRWDYLFTQFRVIVTYIRLIFLPINQNLDYDYPIYRSLFTPSVFLSFLLLLSIFGLGIYLLYRSRFTACPALRSEAGVHSSPTPNSELLTPNSRLVSFGIFWFFITLSVESSIIPIADVIFEHRLYLPSIGAIIAITSLVFTVHSSWFRAYKRWNAIAIVLFGLITVVFAGAAYQRNTVWQNEVSLWEDIVRKSPNKARGHNNLGAAYGSKGLTDKAIEHFQIALRLKPDLAEVHNNLGNAYVEKGMLNEAIQAYRRALWLKPDYAEAYNNLGVAYDKKECWMRLFKHTT